MSYSFLFSGLIGLPVLIAYWVGVVFLGKAGRDSTWWMMLVGLALSSLGTLVAPIALVVAPTMGAGFDDVIRFFPVISGVAGLGTLLFAIGFAIRAMRQARRRDRVEELEAVIEAQNEQLYRKG